MTLTGARRRLAADELHRIRNAVHHRLEDRLAVLESAYRGRDVDAINAAYTALALELEELGPRLAAIRGIDET